MSPLRVPIHQGDHVRGPKDAPIAMAEYGDFECPFCGQAYPQVKRLGQVLGGELRFAFRHFPLTQLHPHALQAAEAAEAAGAQGRFWEMHDLLFENQDALELEDLIAYADQLKLDVRRFGQDLAEHRFMERIHSDFMSGVRSGVNGTPTFFVNGARHDGLLTYEALLAALRGARQPVIGY